MFDVTQLSQSDLAQLKQLLGGLTDVSGRSPIKPRQLHNLTLAPTATDPRPTFFWSAEAPRDAGDLTRTEPYPRLMWHGTTGIEVTAQDADAQATYTASGYVLTAPGNAVAPDPMDELTDMMAGLSDADRKALLQSVQATKIDAIKERLLVLSDAQLAAVLSAAESVETRANARKKGVA